MDWYIILQDSDFRQLFIGKNDCLALCSFRQNNAHTTPLPYSEENGPPK